ncbi:MAG: C45 family autoproteolytic acyltransferase/hydrolase [Endozoicomonas sp.]
MNRVVFKGSARNRGLIHGEQLRDEIHKALAYYRPRFNADKVRLQEHVALMMAKVQAFRPDFIVEMDAIAEASGVESLWIYCLNARSELMSSPVECSSIAFPGAGLIGQNWDWAEALEAQLALADMELENGHRILTMIEPGMLAKIGMNSAGLGVCLNILPADKKLDGVPVHILLRAILECRTLADAAELITLNGCGKASHILVGSVEHQAFAVELAPEKPYFQTLDQPYYLHTNHYLEPGQAVPLASSVCTETRFARMSNMAQQIVELNLHGMMYILSSTEPPFPILRPYEEHELTGRAGTLATILMDLPGGALHLREGFDAQSSYEHFSLKEKLG